MANNIKSTIEGLELSQYAIGFNISGSLSGSLLIGYGSSSKSDYLYITTYSLDIYGYNPFVKGICFGIDEKYPSVIINKHISEPSASALVYIGNTNTPWNVFNQHFYYNLWTLRNIYGNYQINQYLYPRWKDVSLYVEGLITWGNGNGGINGYLGANASFGDNIANNHTILHGGTYLSILNPYNRILLGYSGDMLIIAQSTIRLGWGDPYNLSTYTQINYSRYNYTFDTLFKISIYNHPYYQRNTFLYNISDNDLYNYLNEYNWRFSNTYERFIKLNHTDGSYLYTVGVFRDKYNYTNKPEIIGFWYNLYFEYPLLSAHTSTGFNHYSYVALNYLNRLYEYAQYHVCKNSAVTIGYMQVGALMRNMYADTTGSDYRIGIHRSTEFIVFNRIADYYKTYQKTQYSGQSCFEEFRTPFAIALDYYNNRTERYESALIINSLYRPVDYLYINDYCYSTLFHPRGAIDVTGRVFVDGDMYVDNCIYLKDKTNGNIYRLEIENGNIKITYSTNSVRNFNTFVREYTTNSIYMTPTTMSLQIRNYETNELYSGTLTASVNTRFSWSYYEFNAQSQSFIIEDCPNDKFYLLFTLSNYEGQPIYSGIDYITNTAKKDAWIYQSYNFILPTMSTFFTYSIYI